jgi:hypothetical protein
MELECDPAQAARLQSEAEAATTNHAALQRRHRAGRVLPPHEESALRELDDQLDAVEAEEEYLEQELGELKAKAAACVTTPVETSGERMAGAEAAAMFNTFAQLLTQVQAQEAMEQQRVCLLEDKLEARRHAAEEQSRLLTQREIEYDAKVGNIQ